MRSRIYSDYLFSACGGALDTTRYEIQEQEPHLLRDLVYSSLTGKEYGSGEHTLYELASDSFV